jgi:hypothetical protein
MLTKAAGTGASGRSTELEPDFAINSGSFCPTACASSGADTTRTVKAIAPIRALTRFTESCLSIAMPISVLAEHPDPL